MAGNSAWVIHVTLAPFLCKMNRQIGFGTRMRVSRKPFAAMVRQNRRVVGKTLEFGLQQES